MTGAGSETRARHRHGGLFGDNIGRVGKQELKSGTEIAGRYRLISRIGEGGMGTVWRAEHLGLRSHVAIKLVHPSAAIEAHAVERFMREARAAAALKSPYVVHITDFGIDDQVPFIAMELLEGESLADRLERNGKLSHKETARFMTHVARAVSKAHDGGILHRDLKPDNVFIVDDDDEEIAKVLDFGIAKDTQSVLGTDHDFRTRSGAVLGTPCYMSPEQATGEKGIDTRSDLWSLAIIAFECVVGAKAFRGETLGALIVEICSKPLPVPSEVGEAPEGFDEWFAKAAARDPEQRFDSAREMVQELRKILAPDMETFDDAADQEPARRSGAPPRLSLGRSMGTTGQFAATELGPRSSERIASPRGRYVLFAVLGLGVVGAGYGILQNRTADEAPSLAATSTQSAAAEAPPSATPQPEATVSAPPAPAVAASAPGVAAADAAPSATSAPRRVQKPLATVAALSPKVPAKPSATPAPAPTRDIGF